MFRCPLKNNHTKRLTEKYRKDMLIQVKNDAKKRYFRNLESLKEIEDNIKSTVSESDFKILENVSNKATEKKCSLNPKRD